MLSFPQVESKMKGYPRETLENYRLFVENGDTAALHSFVLGTIAFLVDRDDLKDIQQLPDSTNLQSDLQVESITIAETIFLLEDIFELEISNEDVISLQSIGDLKNFLNKLASRQIS